MTFLIVSNVALWLLVLFLMVVVLLIYKQVGELILDRTAPSRDDQGPDIGEDAPAFEAYDVSTGAQVSYQPKNEVLIFAFPGCPGCDQIAETLPSLAMARQDLGITLLSVFADRDVDQAPNGVATVGEVILPASLQQRNGQEGIRILAAPSASDSSPHRLYGIAATPFAMVVDDEGRVAAKAMLRAPDHLPRLLARDGD